MAIARPDSVTVSIAAETSGMFSVKPVPAPLPVSRAQDNFEEDGTPKDPAYENRAQTFIAELLWFTEAIADQRKKRSSP